MRKRIAFTTRRSRLGFMERSVAVVALCAAVAACGGGGSEASSTPSPAGFWVTPGAGVLITPQSELWLVDAATLAVYQGAVSTNGNAFTATATGYLGTAMAAGTATGTFSERGTLQGTISSQGVSSTFSAVYNTEFDSPPSLASVAGTWSIVGTTRTATIAANGALDASNGGCAATGQMTPDSSGKNFYRVSLTLGPAPCAIPGATVSGIAAGTSNRLVIALVAAGTAGQAYILTR